MQITVTLNNYDKIRQTFEQAPVKMTREISTAIQHIIAKIHLDAVNEAPVNKQSGGGSLKQSIRYNMLTPTRGIVTVESKYGIYVHEGTRPHEIRVKDKMVLANKRTGQIFGKVVHHPGTKPNPFLTRAVEKNKDYINQEFDKAIANALK